MSHYESPPKNSKEYKDPEYEKILAKRACFERMGDKYTEHTQKMVSSRYFRHMRKELHQFNEFYNEILDHINNDDFDFQLYEKKFNQMIENDNEVMRVL